LAEIQRLRALEEKKAQKKWIYIFVMISKIVIY
jgi:hypothetical protein